ncbi:MAG: hypothetical protein NTW79_01510 [Candidatus Berkelbacteria bacterium]|nr:hypothetical protein [Candidatus Berkelbacteria bacterium]
MGEVIGPEIPGEAMENKTLLEILTRLDQKLKSGIEEIGEPKSLYYADDAHFAKDRKEAMKTFAEVVEEDIAKVSVGSLEGIDLSKPTIALNIFAKQGDQQSARDLEILRSI